MEENVKAKQMPKLKERRQPHSQDGMPKKSNKNQGPLKNDLPQKAPSHPFEGTSPTKKLFIEANKIVKIGMEKEFALLERDTTLQNSNETIDNLRKNILHLQMEYEKLDQNYQREISCRSDIVKRMDATRELVDSVVQCSRVLSDSVKQVEDDKLKIAEFYEMIYENQKEVEAKHIEIEKFMKGQEELLKSKLQEINKSQCKILSQNSETISQLSKKLIHSNDKLKITTNENEDLQRKIQQLQESSARLQTFLEQQEKLNCLHQENILQFRQNLKKLKIHRFKYQKLLTNKKKQLSAAATKNKNLKKTLEKAELLHRECASTIKSLESKENEWRNNFENHLEEDAMERQSWEAHKQELNRKLSDKQTEIADLREENENYNSKILEMATNEGAKRNELEQIQNELSKMLNENLKLKEDVVRMTEENNDKAKIISELEIKSSTIDAGFNSQLEFHKNECEKLRDVVKKLESQLFDVQKRLACEKTEREKIISDLNGKLEERVQESHRKIIDLEKLLEDKAAHIEKLESERSQTAANGEASLGKLNTELQLEKSRNKELNTDLENMKEKYDVSRKQLEREKDKISGFEEKLADLNSLNASLSRARIELQKNADDLRNEIELGKKLFGDLEEKHNKAEKELEKMQKITEENSTLKCTTDELKNRLEATEVRLEAYKVAVKKLESENIDAKNSHSEEMSKLKSELTRLEETMKKDRYQSGIPKAIQNFTENTQQNKKEPMTPITRTREKPYSRELSAKGNETEVGDIEKWRQSSASPLQGGRKFLSTPRKIFTSTPQTSFLKTPPISKRRDPYEFDSDSSVERIDPDKVLKVFSRQKRGITNKRSKTNK